MAKVNIDASSSSPVKAHLKPAIRHVPSSARILLVSEAPEDHTIIRRILSGTPCQIAIARSCAEVIGHLACLIAPIILCEQSLPDGSWRDVLDHICGYPEVPVLIVTSMLADDHLWAEVLNLGGYDVLAKP